MKKLLTGMLALLLGASVCMAQGPVAKQKDKAKKEQQAGGQHLKKDGTPDKRFKENKAAKTEGPKKKDGTPDMRYKQNKEAAKKKA